MTNTKLIEVAERYRFILKERGYHSVELNKSDYDKKLLGMTDLGNHSMWMLGKVIEFVNKSQEEPAMHDKAHTWLGFVQGILHAFGYFTINELREHNREKEKPVEHP